MKKILVIGATGSLAKFVIEALKQDASLELFLFARNPGAIDRPVASGCNLIQGNAKDFKSVRQAVDGMDLVYVNLAGDLDAMSANIIKAMKEAGVKKIIAISSIGIYASPLRSVLVPYRKLADNIEVSGLEYTILRPDWFTDADEVDYATTKKGEPEAGTAISRKSIAAFVRSIVSDPESYVNANLGISKPD